MKPRWKTFEDQVREIASLIYARPCEPGRVAGNDIDGIIENDSATRTLIEITVNCTLEKVRSDINKLVLARNALFGEGILSRALVVIDREPTTAMSEGGNSNNVVVLNHNQLAAQFIEYERYRQGRHKYPFGSAVNPETGDIDETDYVPVRYVDTHTNQEVLPKEIADDLLDGKNVVLLGEYGSGKSRCVSQVFSLISAEWGMTFQFPLAINLRECWGLERADEIIRRHFNKLGLDDMAASAVRAYNRKNIVFLLDGFDEIGTQSWSTDDARLRQLRANALVATKDAARNSGTGILITGREHYFSSEKEMLAALGLPAAKTRIMRVKDEFTTDEMLAYFQAANISVALPEWLPRRPLICQTIAQLEENEREDMFGVGNNEAGFWNYFIDVICKRDARINASFDANTIYEVFVTLAGGTRNKSGDVGPIDQRELQDAFEAVVGQIPVEDAAVMLQRLPSLGRVAPDSGDRQFIDSYILDGLRAHHVHRLVTGDEAGKRRASSEKWTNPLQPLGQKVVASKAAATPGGYMNLAKMSSQDRNHTLAGDIVAGMIRINGGTDFEGLVLSDAAISELNFIDGTASNLTIQQSTIEEVVVPASPPKATALRNNLIGKIRGASSISGLGEWINDNEIEQFDSVSNTSRIRDAGLSPPHEILVTIIKKTFFQPGSGRKEEALLRGFAAGSFGKVAPKVLNILVGAGVLTFFRGEEGRVYAPNRSAAGRMKQMLDELRSSADPIWMDVGSLE
jgi:hypothetical protein